jgi:hypothetical protein
MAAQQLFAGESKLINITLTDENGNPVDINGATFKWKLNVRNNPVIKQSPSEDIVITDATNGKVQIKLQPSDTSSLSGIYKTDLELTDSNGNVSVIQLDMLQVKTSPFN